MNFAEYCDILLSCQWSPIYVRRVTLCKCDGVNTAVGILLRALCAIQIR
ncbi:hypothetical protein T06_1126 [Trichinella sp. T6]|nr:hypothetical protein T06_1126 [Trichinella sp. T6]